MRFINERSRNRIRVFRKMTKEPIQSSAQQRSRIWNFRREKCNHRDSIEDDEYMNWLLLAIRSYIKTEILLHFLKIPGGLVPSFLIYTTC